MADLAMQLSLYPLRQAHLGPVIEEALEVFGRYNLRLEPGAMSTVIAGDDEAVFAALKEAYGRVAGQGVEIVMVVTLSNACPVRSVDPSTPIRLGP